jgi:hypothetical protein
MDSDIANVVDIVVANCLFSVVEGNVNPVANPNDMNKKRSNSLAIFTETGMLVGQDEPTRQGHLAGGLLA